MFPTTRSALLDRKLDASKRPQLPIFAHFETSELLAFLGSAVSGKLYDGYDADLCGEHSFDFINTFTHQVKEAIDRPGSLINYSVDGFLLFSDITQFKNEYYHLKSTVFAHSIYIHTHQERNRFQLEQASKCGFIPFLDDHPA